MKTKKESWEIVLKDRFLTNEKPDNLYVTVLLYFVVFFLSFILIFVCFFQLCRVEGTSMLNTLESGSHVLLLKTSQSYNRGDIVVIKKGEGKEATNIIKRIVGVGGDTLKFVIDDEKNPASTVHLELKKQGEEEFTVVDESDFIKNGEMHRNKIFPTNFDFNAPIVLEENEFYVLGDNRDVSEDSRKGQIYGIDNIMAKSVFTVQKGSFLEWFLKFLYHEKTTPTSDN